MLTKIKLSLGRTFGKKLTTNSIPRYMYGRTSYDTNRAEGRSRNSIHGSLFKN